MKIFLKVFIMFLLSFWVLSLIQCSPKRDSGQQQISNDIAADKDQLLNDLRNLRRDLDRQIDHINDKIRDASDDSKVRLERARENYIKQRDAVDQQLTEVKNSTKETFVNIKISARKGYEDIREGFKKAGDDIRDIFDKDKS
jgi:hypothetical protein